MLFKEVLNNSAGMYELQGFVWMELQSKQNGNSITLNHLYASI